jgi:hypothetical protein
VLSVALLAIAGVAVALAGADRLLALIAVRRVARHLTARLGATSAPAVRIAGAPFLTQVLSGVYRQVEVTLAAFRAGGTEFRGLTAYLSLVRAPLRDLLAGRGPVAGDVRVTATIPLSAIGGRLPPGLVLRRQGTELAVSGFVLLMPVSGTLTIRADRQRICVVPKVLGVPSLVGFVITLPGLPPRLTIDTLDVTDAGLQITMRGENVDLGPS